MILYQVAIFVLICAQKVYKQGNFKFQASAQGFCRFMRVRAQNDLKICMTNTPRLLGKILKHILE